MANISKGFVSSHPGGSATTNTTLTGFNSDVTGDGFYVLAVAGGGTGATVSPVITDNYGNAALFTQIGSIVQAGASSLFLSRYYCQNAAGGINHTVTATWAIAPSASTYVVFEQILGGSLTALYTGQSNQATYLSSTANPFTSGTVAVTAPASGILLFSSLSFALPTSTQGTITESVGFSLDAMTTTTFADNCQSASLFESSSGTYNASWSSSKAGTSSTPFIVVIDAFQGAAPAISPLPMGAKQTFVTDTIWQY